MSAEDTKTFPAINYQTREIVDMEKSALFGEDSSINSSINYDVVETVNSDKKEPFPVIRFKLSKKFINSFTFTYQPLIYIDKPNKETTERYMKSTCIFFITDNRYDVYVWDYENGLGLFGYTMISARNPGQIIKTNLYSKGEISGEAVSFTEDLDSSIKETPDYISRKFFYVTHDMWQIVCKPLFFKKNNIKTGDKVETFPSYYGTANDKEYSELMGYSIGPKQLRDILKSYREKGVETIPDIDFMHDVGTKEYVRHMKHFMLPETFVYPDDKDILEKSLIPDLTYVVKSGMTSSGQGVQSKVGSEVVKLLENYTPYSFRLRSSHKSIGGDDFILDKDFDKYNEVENDCTSRIFIIQPKNAIYNRCHEFRFFVLRDKIIGVADPRGERVEKIYKSGTILNKDIYDYIHKVISHISERYNNYLFMRVDIIMECGYFPPEDLKDDYSNWSFYPGNIPEKSLPPRPENIDILFSDEDLKDKMWLNEIEPLGSGHKARSPVTLYDTDKSAVVIYGKHEVGSDLGPSIVESICYQTHRLINNMDNKDITICLVNINWLNKIYNGDITHVNLIAYGIWTWNFVQELIKKQLYTSLGGISDIRFYVLTKDTKTELP